MPFRQFASEGGSAEATDLAKRIADADCLSSGTLKFKEPAMRAHFYEIVYRREFARTPAGDIAAAAPVDYAAGGPGGATNEVALRAFADCVTRSDPVSARQLVLSEPATSMEKQGFEALSPSFSGCLPKDQQLAFSKTILKGLVAETLYRLSRSIVPPAVAGRAN
jgi:hypothetical protein